MSLGVAAILADTVLLVAEGKRTHFLADDVPQTDANNKIFKINSSIGAIAIGLVPVTDVAIPHLVATLPKDSGPYQVKAHVEQSLYAGWMSMLGRLGPDVDLYHPEMKAALIVGGLAADIPFVTSTLFYVDQEKQLAGVHDSVITTDIYRHILLGGEEQNSQSEFSTRAQCVIAQHRPATTAERKDAVLMGVLEAAAETIRLVEINNPSVGGTIRYACIHRRYPYTTGVSTAEQTWTCDVPLFD